MTIDELLSRNKDKKIAEFSLSGEIYSSDWRYDFSLSNYQDADILLIKINSIGGSVTGAFSLVNLVQEWKRKKQGSTLENRLATNIARSKILGF